MRKRGCVQDQMARRSPSMVSSRPVALLTAFEIGPRSVFRPKVTNSAITTMSAATARANHLRTRMLHVQQSTCLGGDGFLHLGDPCLAPLQRRFLRQDAAGSVVHVALADADGAE